MRNGWTVLTAVVLVGALVAAAPGEEASVLLEKAIHEEETAGNIDGAITIYKQIVASEESDPRWAAEAQYRLGTCYLKKRDKNEARLGFLGVIARYPRQGKIAMKARKQLSRLLPPKSAPIVTGTNPIAFVDDVPFSLDKITVTFDQPMMNGSWSWTGGGETYPKSTRRPYYNSRRTVCTSPVKLEPGKVYWVGINSPSHKNFKTPSRVPAQRYVILFATAGADGKATPIPEDFLARAAAVNSYIVIGEPGPPRVLATSPAALKNDVPPSLEKITVTFNQTMMDGSWSWTGGGDTFPAATGKIYYDGRRTVCTKPVKLEPGKVYWVGINSPSHKNFKTPSRVPAQRYVILFATAGADGKATPIPDDLLARAKEINAFVEKAAQGPPRVVSTSPKALANNVSTSLDKISVTFNQPMMDGSWSWTGGGETFPKTTGKIHYDERKTTCNLPVRLEPGKVYRVGINSPSHKNFKTPGRVPARWYIILFATAGADGKPTPIPKDLLARAKAINSR